MKKVLFLAVTLAFGFSAFAQMKPAHISNDYRNVKAVKPARATHETMNFNTEVNQSVAPAPSKSVSEYQVGTTRYDLQSNACVANRIYLHSDGTIGTTFTYGITDPNFADRGSAYNYFDGSAWGATPTARLEANRSGWPSYAPLGATGEIVVSHNGSTGLLINKRDPKGTGAWTQSLLEGPTTTGGTTALLWPRMITNGNTIHIIACTDQATAPAVWYYEGLALALVYIRSTDGGTTWDAPRILPGMDSASIVSFVNAGFGGDSYGWANPVGDTIAFFVNEGWMGMFVEKSYDGGDTWTKVDVFSVPAPTAWPTPKFCTTDGYGAVALDDQGKAHVAFGRMRVNMSVQDLDSSFYYPYTDGLIYWNENMPVLDTTQLGDVDGLYTAGQWIGSMLDYNGDTTINYPTPPAGELPFGKYFSSATSFPQILVDGNVVYVTYSQLREDKIDATSTKLLRHLFATKLEGGVWADGMDLTSDIIHDYDECVFGSLSQTSDNNLHILYQADPIAGLAVRGDETAYGDNNIYYIAFPKSDFAGVKENNTAVTMNIYPNPADEYSYIDINLTKSSKVNLTVTNLVGQTVFTKTYGNLASGNQKLVVNVSNLNSGIYFFTIQAGNERLTKKIIVE